MIEVNATNLYRVLAAIYVPEDSSNPANVLKQQYAKWLESGAILETDLIQVSKEALRQLIYILNEKKLVSNNPECPTYILSKEFNQNSECNFK